MLVNGRAESTLPADDRGLLYGDGLFETVRVVEGGLRLWSRHIDRLKRGCESLRIELDFSFDELFEEASTLCRGQSGVLRVTVTRGSGPRGYRIPVMVKSTRVLQFSAGSNFAVPNGPDQGAAVTVCNMRLGRQPVLAGIKHLNRLEQVLARSEWGNEFHEGVMLDVDGNVIEGTMSNVFVLRDNELLTPDVSACGVAGVMRSLVLEEAPKAGFCASVGTMSLNDIDQSDGVFLTNSVIGIWPVKRIRDRVFNDFSPLNPLLKQVEGKW